MATCSETRLLGNCLPVWLRLWDESADRPKKQQEERPQKTHGTRDSSQSVIPAHEFLGFTERHRIWRRLESLVSWRASPRENRLFAVHEKRLLSPSVDH